MKTLTILFVALLLMPLSALKADDAGATSTAKWQKVTSFSGNTDKNTEPFTISSNRWRVTWRSSATAEAHKASMDAAAEIGVDAVRDNGSKDIQTVVSVKLGPGGETTELRGAGAWLFKVNSANSDWTIVVEEYR